MIEQIKITFDDLKPKATRIFIAACIFLGMITFPGCDARVSQEIMLYSLSLCFLGLFFRNIWIALFLWWSVFLFVFFQFVAGKAYLTNIFSGAVLYFLTVISFKRQHIKFYLNIFLWFVFINIAYQAVQLAGWDEIFVSSYKDALGNDIYQKIKDPTGFMYYKSAVGMLSVMAQAVLLARHNLMSKIAGFAMILPIYISEASICVIASIFIMAFNVWENYYEFKIGKWIINRAKILFIVAPLVLLSVFMYTTQKDNLGTSCKLRCTLWSEVLKDAYIHPVTGWGLDSFRRDDLPWKNFCYAANIKETIVEGKTVRSMDKADNAHSLPLQLFYEWGIFGLLILIGLYRQYFLWYQRSSKTPEIIGLFGILVSVLIMSLAHFPMFVARLAIIIVVCAALFEVATREA